jgi:hypothetical protein
MPYKVQFVGLVCFVHDSNMRWALLPDGTHPDGVDPHYPSIMMANDSIEDATGWGGEGPDANGKITPPPGTLVLEGADVPGTLDDSQQEEHLPHLKQIDERFQIDLARAVLRIPIRRGTLRVYTVPGGSALITELLVAHDGPITLTLTPADGTPPRTVRLKPGTEVLIGNMAARGIYDRTKSDRHLHHFQIYEKLSVAPVVLPEPEPPVAKAVPRSQSQHWYFMRQGPIGLDHSCSNSTWP